jgi:hypothetical protein
MKTNPGGQIPPSEVIGRDQLIRRLWRVLDRQSLVLSAERRMGKTCIIQKMVAEAPQDKLPIYHDLEGIRTPLEFVETVFHDVEGYLGRLQRTAGRVREWLAHLAGMEIDSVIKLPDAVAPHWKTLLTKTIEDLVEQQDRTLIFFWDEMPLMLYNIKQQSGEAAAIEILDTLRSLRQMHRGLRMVFTGSVGLHNVITSLKRAGYANDPTNDMATEDVPALSPDAARELACQLVKGEGLQTDDLQETIRAIVTAVDCIPFFIHHIVDEIAQLGSTVDVATIGEVVDACLTDSYDRWHLRYYCERIDTYYAPDGRLFALNLLDVLSVTDHPLVFDDVFNLLKSRLETEDNEMARHVLTLLQRDHYIIQQTNGMFRFRFPLIQRSWRLRGRSRGGLIEY